MGVAIKRTLAILRAMEGFATKKEPTIPHAGAASATKDFP